MHAALSGPNHQDRLDDTGHERYSLSSGVVSTLHVSQARHRGFRRLALVLVMLLIGHHPMVLVGHHPKHGQQQDLPDM